MIKIRRITPPSWNLGSEHCRGISRRGFTLIELLVVISIIAILSTLVVAAINVARAKARDTKRMHDLRTIGKALEMYYADNGKYPGSSGMGFNAGYYSSANFIGPIANINSELEDYITGSLPKDSIDNGIAPYTGYGYTYIVNSDGSKYELATVLETDNPLRCKYINYISYTGKPVGLPAPNIGASWCGPSMSAFGSIPSYAYVVYPQ